MHGGTGSVPADRAMASVASRISDLLAGAARQLREGGIEEPRREARWLMARVLDISDSRLFAHADDIVDEAGVGRYQDAVRRRAAHEPFAYVVGEQDFWGHSFVVDRRVLVPRPETEILIMEAAAILATWERGHPPGSAGFQPAPDGGGQDGRAPRSNGPLVVDVGTGSGAIACTLALEVPDSRVISCDVSPDALAVTSVNRERL